MDMLKKISRTIFAIFLLWAFGFVFFSVSALTASPQKTEETSDAIVVLTGGAMRVEEGLSLFANGRASHLYISGAHKDVKKRDITQLWTGDHSLPPCCITLDHKATSTSQNAKETGKWVFDQDYSSVRLVTGNYHMARSLMEFKHALPGVDIYAHPVKQDDLGLFAPKLWNLLFSEYHKTIFRWTVLLVTPRPDMPEDA